VGEDRLLNAAGAYRVLQQACVVIDAGTAITVDFVDGAGTFHGGAIGPGAQMMLASLHQHTALLPEVEFEVPAEPIGHNTRQAMLSAVYYGLRGMVRELVEQYAQVAGAFPMVVATGGNADVLFQGFDLVDRIVPDLALLGIAATLAADESDDDAGDAPQ
jgi:type III pantothenate kinase